MHKQSPVHTHHITHGAAMIDRAGWLVPDRFAHPEQEADAVRNGVGLIDRSDVGKIEINGSGLAAWVSRTFETEVAPQKTAHVTITDGLTGLCCWLRDDRGLLIVPAEHTEDAIEALSGTAEELVHVTDVSSVYCALQLMGPHSLNVMYRITSLDVRPSRLPSGACVQGSAMKVPALLARDDMERFPAYWILVTRDYGEFVWEAVRDAGKDYGLQPVGYGTFRQLDI